MQKTQTTEKCSPFKIRFREQLKSNRLMFIGLVILNLLGLPLAAFEGMRFYYHRNLRLSECIRYEDDIFISLLMITGYIFTFISVLAGILCVLRTFSYMQNRQKADIAFSLPVDRKSLFMADWLAGFVLYMVPALISSAVTAVILAICEASFSGVSLYFEKSTRPGLSAVFCILAVLVSMILFYSFAALCSVHSSSVAGVVISILCLNFAVSNGMYNAGMLAVHSLADPEDPYMIYNYAYQLKSFLSPEGMLEFAPNYPALRYPWLTMAVNTAAAVLVFLISRRVYLRRRPEDASGSRNNPFVYCTVVFFAAVIAVSMKMTDAFTGLSALLITAVIFAVSEYFRFRVQGRKRFSFIYPLASAAAAAAIALFLPSAGSKAYISFIKNCIPPAEKVHKIELNSDIPGGFGCYISLENQEIIELAEEMHRSLNENDRSYNSDQVFSCYLTYYLNNGRFLNYSYSVNYDGSLRNTASELLSSEYVKEQVSEAARRMSSREKMTPIYNEDTYEEAEVSMSELFSILSGEVLTMTKEDLMNTDKSEFYSHYTSFGNIPECYTESINYIRDLLENSSNENQ